MNHSVNKMIDNACKPVDPPNPIPEDMPYVTHEGVLDLHGVNLRCYILSSGERIFNAEDVKNFLIGRNEAYN